MTRRYRIPHAVPERESWRQILRTDGVEIVASLLVFALLLVVCAWVLPVFGALLTPTTP